MSIRKSIATTMAAVIGVAFATGAALAQDPLIVGPDLYKGVFENDRVRILEVTFAPGAKIGKHSHPDHFGYVLSSGKLKIFKSDGSSMEAEPKVGEVLWIPAETHWAENAGETEIKILVVELKEPAPKVKKPKKVETKG